MDWKFHCVPGEEYPSRYVENEAKVKIGYLGYAKRLHHFEYTRGSFGLGFAVTAAEYDRVDERRLGPKCKIWIVDGRIPLDIAQVVVFEIADVILTGAY